jgi:hypothetical protein
VRKGFGVFLVSIMMLLCGCAGAEETEPEFKGVRVLMRYDFDIQEYASVDSAQREMERWVDAYKTESPEDQYIGTITFSEMKETEEGYQGYLDCGDIESFAGVHVYNLDEGMPWEQDNPVVVTEMATGEEVSLDEAYLSGLPASYEMVYGPVESLLMGSDRIVLEMNGQIQYATAGWNQDGDRIAADSVELYERGDGYFVIVYEPEGIEGKDAGKYSWVNILVVGILGIAGILILSKYEMREMPNG